MATQVLTSTRPRGAPQRPAGKGGGGFLHGLEQTATAIGHGLTIANAVKGAIPVARTIGRVAMAALPAIL